MAKYLKRNSSVIRRRSGTCLLNQDNNSKREVSRARKRAGLMDEDELAVETVKQMMGMEPE